MRCSALIGVSFYRETIWGEAVAGTNTMLTKKVSVARYREMEKADDRAACGQFIVDRFYERYFEPTENAPARHGFTLMAIGCLVIEALESFYQGKKDSKGESAKMFEEFFKRPTGLRVFGNGDWFYKQIRCGILHQAETTAGWRILRKGKLLDEDERTINATLFIRHLQAAVVDYAEQLEMDNKLWRKFRRKMNAVCENCVATAPAAPVQGNP